MLDAITAMMQRYMLAPILNVVEEVPEFAPGRDGGQTDTRAERKSKGPATAGERSVIVNFSSSMGLIPSTLARSYAKPGIKRPML